MLWKRVKCGIPGTTGSIIIIIIVNKRVFVCSGRLFHVPFSSSRCIQWEIECTIVRQDCLGSLSGMGTIELSSLVGGIVLASRDKGFTATEEYEVLVTERY